MIAKADVINLESNVNFALTFGIFSMWLKMYMSGISKSKTFLVWLSNSKTYFYVFKKCLVLIAKLF